jgi:opacity protein-like surface antigen
MKGFGRLMMAFGVLVAGLTGTAWAQAAAPDGPYAAQFTIGPTFGNASDIALGGELDYRLRTEWELFVEGGRMLNVATSDMEDAAQIVVNALGGEAAVAQKATYFNAGVKYLFVPFGGGYTPYVALGAGLARLTKDVKFTVDGNTLDEARLLEQYGVQLGNDLAGGSTRPMLTVIAGVSRNFRTRTFFDLSYRYGAIFGNSDHIENDSTTNTQRLQIGIGIRF